jgi:hypothetical protein
MDPGSRVTLTGLLPMPPTPVVVDIPDHASPASDPYVAAAGDLSKVPWAGSSHPCLVSWLNHEAPGRLRPGARALVVGCALGDDVAELNHRGYDATGVESSSAAVAWARRRFPDFSHAFVHADPLALPTRYRHRFELVASCDRLHALPDDLRPRAAAAIADLCAPRGLVIIITSHAAPDTPAHTPAHTPALTPDTLTALMHDAGLKPAAQADDFLDELTNTRRLRALFERA